MKTVGRACDKLISHLRSAHRMRLPLRCVRESRVCGRHLSSEAAATVAFASPFLLYLLCSRAMRRRRRWWRRECGVIFFTEPVCLQLLFQRKFANGSPLSALVRCFCAGFHILCDNFFLPERDAYRRRRQHTPDMCVTIFMPWPRWIRSGRLTCDRWTTVGKKKREGEHNRRRPKDYRHEIPPRSWLLAKWIFVSLLFLAITPSGVEWNSVHRNAVTRENRVYRKSLDLACAPCAPARPALQGTRSNAKGRS